MWKWIVSSLVAMVLLAGGGAFAAFKFGVIGGDGFNREPASIEVRVAEVKRSELVRAISAPGTVEPRTAVNMSARVSSTIIALPFREGDDVQAGDVVARLDAEDLQSRLEAAQSRLKAEHARLMGSKASLVLAELEFGRLKELLSTGDVSTADMDRAEAQYEQAKANMAATEAGIEVTEAEIEEREKALAYTIITSPIDGTITRLNLEVGEQVLGTLQNAGTVIMQIADLGEMLVKARVDETNISLVEAGQAVEVYLTAYPDRLFKGEVERIRLERQIFRDGTSYVEAEIVIEQSEGDRLKIGLTANADIAVQTLSDVLKAPSQAVLGRRIEDLPTEVVAGNAHVDINKTFTQVVYLMVDGKAIATPVATGPSDLNNTVILGGLSEGDRIVVGPYSILGGLEHEQRIRDRDAPAVESTNGEEIAGDGGEDSAGEPGEDAAEEIGESIAEENGGESEDDQPG